MSGTSEQSVHLRIAVVGGPQYDRLYERLKVFEQQTGHKVTIVFRGNHPELNHYLATTFPTADFHAQQNQQKAEGGDQTACSQPPPLLDLVSTHIKYAPSQSHFLLPLDEATEITPDEQAEFLEAPLKSCRVHGRLVQLPRMIDSRVLFYRRDLLERAGILPPKSHAAVKGDEGDHDIVSQWTWQDLIRIGRQVKEAKIPISQANPKLTSLPSSPKRSRLRLEEGDDTRQEDDGETKNGVDDGDVGHDEYVHGYVFPGKQSGLFGTFYELAMMMKESPDALFDPQSGQPVMDVDVVAKVLEYMRELVQQGVVPANIEDYYFDEVSQAFQQGRVALVADWPSFFGGLKKQLLDWWMQEQEQQQEDARGGEEKETNGDDSQGSRERGGVEASSPLTCPRPHPKIEVGVMRYCPGWNGTRSAYSGMHSFAIPRSCRYRAQAVQLLKFLVADEQQWLEASESGSFPTKKSVLDRLKRETRARADQAGQKGSGQENSCSKRDDENEEQDGQEEGDGDEESDMTDQQMQKEAKTPASSSSQGLKRRRPADQEFAMAARATAKATAAKAASVALANLEVRRLECLSATIESDMAMFPHLACYPELEDELFPMIQDAMMGRRRCHDAAKAIQAKAQAIAARS
ncbi:hypothetical protein BGZ73_001720 [Actinomortierella ambigua]|nr:hypothetical protein BGZ73_001720 [Actinomortierella ambigua]